MRTKLFFFSRLFFLTVSLGLPMACTQVPYSSIDKTQYLGADHAKNLVIQAPLTSENLSHYYDLPPKDKNPRVSILPPDLK